MIGKILLSNHIDVTGIYGFKIEHSYDFNHSLTRAPSRFFSEKKFRNEQFSIQES